MNDPHAKQVLDSAGFGLGIQLKRAYEKRLSDNSEGLSE